MRCSWMSPGRGSFLNLRSDIQNCHFCRLKSSWKSAISDIQLIKDKPFYLGELFILFYSFSFFFFFSSLEQRTQCTISTNLMALRISTRMVEKEDKRILNLQTPLSNVRSWTSYLWHSCCMRQIQPSLFNHCSMETCLHLETPLVDVMVLSQKAENQWTLTGQKNWPRRNWLQGVKYLSGWSKYLK